MTTIAGKVTWAALLFLGACVASTAAKALGEGTCSSYGSECAFEDSCLDNGNGTFRCGCPEGTSGNGFKKEMGGGGCTATCKSTSECPEFALCDLSSSTVGVCRCKPGFTGDAIEGCTDIDECTEGSHNCDVNAECTNQDGSFQCTCLEGYTGDGKFGTCIQPSLCAEGNCTAPNTECRNGLCVCQMGFALDCENCEDIDECASDENCGHLGQVCINTPGSYRCECVDGFYADGGYCHDINECEDGTGVCGQHSECRNLLGTYKCVCCLGYTKRGAACRRDKGMDVVYGAPGEECCACTGGDCGDPKPVCASNGQSYPNYASMVVAGCRDDVTLDVSYKGYCESSCSAVVCDRPFQTCVETPKGALCVCPICETVPENATPVCGSNGFLYASECIFQLIICSMGMPGVTLRPLEYCSEPQPDNESPLSPWSPWTECSPTCGKGYMSRSRSAAGQTAKPLTQRVACYTLCPNGPCEEDSCPNPGQVCEVGANSEAVCSCPDCSGQPEEPVCALLGDLVRTFENECQLQSTACQLTKPFQILEDRACEDKPPMCGKTSYTPEVVEGDCVAKLPEDLGFCYGKCSQNPAWCCRPEATETVSLTVTFDCQDGSSRSEQRDFVKILLCGCTQEPQRNSEGYNPQTKGISKL